MDRDSDIKNLFLMSGVVFIMAGALQESQLKKRGEKSRRWWTTRLFKSRVDGELLQILRSQETSGHYKNFTRMSSVTFEELVTKIGPRVAKQSTKWRESISVQARLAVTLRFLATGDSYTSLQYLFKISKQSITTIVPEVCQALVETLKEYIKLPNNPADWMNICQVFENIWNLPHCFGAMDGKHVAIQAPIKSGSEFFNYKSHFSIVLFALVDGNCNFLFADVGCQGRISDGGIFNASKLNEMLTNKSLGLPDPCELPGRQIQIPYYIAADSAFALGENIMKPYAGDHRKGSPQRIFNYRLSRGRRVVENAFGIISQVFRVLRKPMLLEPNKAQIVVMAIIHLHNFLNQSSSNVYATPELMDREENGTLIEGSWRRDNEMTSMISIRNTPRRSAAVFQKIRDELADYFVKEGALPWQDRY